MNDVAPQTSVHALADLFTTHRSRGWSGVVLALGTLEGTPALSSYHINPADYADTYHCADTTRNQTLGTAMSVAGTIADCRLAAKRETRRRGLAALLWPGRGNRGAL